MNFSSHLSLETLKQKEHFLLLWAKEHFFLSSILLFFLYIASICLLIPACTVLTLFAGMIYPMPYAIALSILSETVGTCVFFIVLRLAVFPKYLHRKIARLKRMRKEFQTNPACYLLFLRFSHFTPSWLITTGAVLFKSPLWTFAWTTLLGIIPVSYLVVDAAHAVKSAHNLAIWNWETIFTTQTKMGLFTLGVMALIPIAIQKWRRR
jgi:uncharacterized membrane protein YdjX (TVP38/TMEM64 family)